MSNPYVGLRPFATSESNLFFGRDKEAQILSSLVATLPVLVVYAPSGTGKSSLLNAGLAPLIQADTDQLSVFVDADDDLLTSVRGALVATGWAASNPSLDLADLVGAYWFATDRRVIVIVDQLEERLNAGKPVDDLYSSIAKMVHSGSDAACVVLSIREDYLGSLEPLMRRVPGLMNGSFRVPRLARQALEVAIYGPLSRVPDSIEVDAVLASEVLDDLEQQAVSQQEPGEQRFEPGYFQIVWSTLWAAATERRQAVIGPALYRDLGRAESILRDFTSRILESLEPVQAEVFWAISRYLVLPTGAKVPLTVDDLVQLVRPWEYLDLERLASDRHAGRAGYDLEFWSWREDLTHDEAARLSAKYPAAPNLW